jgi:DNA invertase Pin-like site-specific DNA recombinase
MRVAIYARVSTKDKGQDTQTQLHQLRTFAEQHGSIQKVYTDQESGGKADRTGFKHLLVEAYQQKFDLVVFWRLDRFSREGALATLRYLKELKDQRGELQILHRALPRQPRAVRRRDCFPAGHHRGAGPD